jgi:hypothetical protein
MFFHVQVDCVISALDLHISYIKMLKAATYLNRENVIFLATNDDASIPRSDEIVMPGNEYEKKKEMISFIIKFRCRDDFSFCYSSFISFAGDTW